MRLGPEVVRPWHRRVMLTRKRTLSKAERALWKSHRSNNEGDDPSMDWNTYGPGTDEIRSPHPDEPYKCYGMNTQRMA